MMTRSGDGESNFVFCVADVTPPPRAARGPSRGPERPPPRPSRSFAERWGRRGRGVPKNRAGRGRSDAPGLRRRDTDVRAWEGTAKSWERCRVKPLQCFFVGFAGSRSVGPGRQGAALVGAGRDSCPCNRKRLPPRARARKQRAGACWPPGAPCTNRLASRPPSLSGP